MDLPVSLCRWQSRPSSSLVTWRRRMYCWERRKISTWRKRQLGQGTGYTQIRWKRACALLSISTLPPLGSSFRSCLCDTRRWLLWRTMRKWRSMEQQMQEENTKWSNTAPVDFVEYHKVSCQHNFHRPYLELRVFLEQKCYPCWRQKGTTQW